MHPILRKLEGSDRRSIGRSREVVADVIADPALFNVVFSGLLSENPLLRLRAADAAERLVLLHPEYLAPHRATLLDRVARLDQKEVRWHAAQMLTGYLNDRSSIGEDFCDAGTCQSRPAAPGATTCGHDSSSGIDGYWYTRDESSGS
jgi:hypothetical protein